MVEEETTEIGTPQSEVNETDDSQDESGEIDYKAELEKERKRREKAEYTLRKRNEEDKQRRETSYVDDDDIDARIDAKVEARLNQMRATQVSDVIDEVLGSVGSSPEERELIKYHYENSVIQSGLSRAAVQEDMRKAKLLANASKYERENAELAETVKSKRAMGKSGGTNQDKASYSEDLSKHFTASEWEFMQRRKFTDDMIKSAANAKKVSK